MKKEYEYPELEIIQLETLDIITSSDEGDEDDTFMFVLPI